jgi:uncharacterized protein
MVQFDVSVLINARLGESLTLDVDAGPQRIDDLELNFLRGTIRATRVQGGILVQGTIGSQLDLECVRCLEPFSLPITLELEEIFRLPWMDPRADAPYIVNSDSYLDLTPLLREQSWLIMPMKPVCDPECKGLCPQCGADLNQGSCTCVREEIDPRLALLKELL